MLHDLKDISVPEAYPLKDFDEAAVKSGYSDAQKNINSENAQLKAVAQIESNVYTSLARALGVTL
jgi:F0F1-type ATP synthase epsilon subunit